MFNMSVSRKTVGDLRVGIGIGIPVPSRSPAALRVSRLGAVTVIRQRPEGQRISPAIRLGYLAR
jgi:hypothetical protein